MMMVMVVCYYDDDSDYDEDNTNEDCHIIRLWYGVDIDLLTCITYHSSILTHDTHSVCPSSTIVNLHSPRVFHSLIDRSLEADTICLLSLEKATDRTSLECPTKRRVHLPDVYIYKWEKIRYDIYTMMWMC